MQQLYVETARLKIIESCRKHRNIVLVVYYGRKGTLDL